MGNFLRRRLGAGERGRSRSEPEAVEDAPRGRGLGDEGAFDAPVALRGNGTPMASLEDVNGDGLLDLVVQVDTEALVLSETAVEAILEGRTSDGVAITGSDSVIIVP